MSPPSSTESSSAGADGAPGRRRGVEDPAGSSSLRTAGRGRSSKRGRRSANAASTEAVEQRDDQQRPDAGHRVGGPGRERGDAPPSRNPTPVIADADGLQQAGDPRLESSGVASCSASSPTPTGCRCRAPPRTEIAHASQSSRERHAEVGRADRQRGRAGPAPPAPPPDARRRPGCRARARRPTTRAGARSRRRRSRGSPSRRRPRSAGSA